MTPKILRVFYSCFLIFFLFLFTGSISAGIPYTIAPSQEQSRQCIKIVNALERNHYLGKRFDNAMSARTLEQYIKRLDPGKQLFTAKDISFFKTKQFLLDDELKSGDLQTGFDMYNLTLARSEKQLKYILELVSKWQTALDFSKKESIIIDNENRLWEPNEDALYDIWRKGLKNHIISMQLEEKKPGEITETLEKIYDIRLQRLSQITATDIFQTYINSLAASFDPHTAYFPPRASEDFDIHMSLSLEGIGAELKSEYEYTKVVRLIPKGPADKSNLLMPGDKIIGVGQGDNGEIKDTVGQRLDHVVRLIRGPKNSFVRLKIIPAKATDTTKTIRIQRDRVKLEEQSAQKSILEIERDGVKHKIGVIEIPNFYVDFNAMQRQDKNYKSTTRDVKRLLAELEQDKIEGLIIDLRNNGGGSLQEANDLTGLFFSTGPTVQIKTRRRTERLVDTDRGIAYRGPVIVLINRMSASASEIFAGAIKDYHRGIIVGSRSFGKGTVQVLQPLGSGKLKLTSAKFYRVSGESTQHLGIVPDIKYPQVYNPEDVGESSLEGALPWDVAHRTSYRPYPELAPVIQRLTADYQKREKTDPGLVYLKNRLELEEELDSQFSLSLNLEQRKNRKKNYEQMELNIENQYLTALGEPEIKSFDELDENDKNRNDYKKILMDQTSLVMSDFIQAAHDMDYRW